MEWFYFLDLFGVAAFAATGALKAFKYKLDLFGVLSLGLVAGLGGGSARELLLGHTPLFLLTDPNYFYVAGAISLGIFFWRGTIKSRRRWFYISDTIGLGVFTAVGSALGQAAGLGAVGIGLVAVITVVGGGILRDILMREVPLVFRKEIYASAAIVGTIVFQILFRLDFVLELVLLLSFFAAIIVRLSALRLDWHLPRTQ